MDFEVLQGVEELIEEEEEEDDHDDYNGNDAMDVDENTIVVKGEPDLMIEEDFIGLEWVVVCYCVLVKRFV